MTEELYKKHRPATFSKLIGQEDTVAAFENLLENNRLPHALLITGPSGCGKTTAGRILKERLGCSDNDFNEINCADFRGIDTIRDIARKIGYAPIGGKCRIWLIDESHKLSKDAMSAFLKILEDTPSHVYFFLCTTDPQKLLKTIKTRCTEMPMKALSEDDLTKLLEKVARKEKKTIPEEVLEQIVRDSAGSARMALVILDKIINMEQDKMLEAAQSKATEENEAIELCRALMKKAPWTEVAPILKNIKGEPESIRYIVLGYCKSVMLKGGKQVSSAYLVADAFRDNFFDSKMPGLVLACYEAATRES